MDPRTLKPGELELIAGTFLFRGQPQDCVLRCIGQESCTKEEFSGGEAIYTPERFRRSLGILCTGSVEVTKGELVVSTLVPGDLFGAAALFTDQSLFETNLTPLNRCGVLFLPQSLVARAMADDPALAANYIWYLSQRIHFLNGKIDGLIAPSARQKLGRYLLAQADGEGRLECSATGLARRLDVGRASLYRAFEALETAGAIRRRGKLVSIVDRNTLQEHSQN